MKKRISLLILVTMLLSTVAIPAYAESKVSGDTLNRQRFMELYHELHTKDNGYFSEDGVPYHTVEELIVEATDYGHVVTSEGFSYYLWLEAMYGKYTGNWEPYKIAWKATEAYMIPSKKDQPTMNYYNPTSPATIAKEYATPESYPSELLFGTPTGKDPIHNELVQAYGDQVYGMHWLLDADNWYGYGKRGDGTSNNSFINTFQRGPEESTWETIPQPSWEVFKWGGPNGFLDLYTIDANYSKQWRYTIASDADARAVQASYYANKWAKEQGASVTDENSKAIKMGDWLRQSFFDKYYKKIGATNINGDNGTGMDSAHYLLGWYYAWGGGIGQGANWAWKIGGSHVHSGYQNPMTAYILANDPDFEPLSTNGKAHWATSLDRQLEFYTWLQSKEGAISGGATNMWNGDYSPRPANVPTFYGLAWKKAPVYVDPEDSRWFGMQTWTMQRVAQLYYETGNLMAKNLLDKWVPWAISQVKLHADGTYEIPCNLIWTGQPDTWTGTSTGNPNLSVTVETWNQDIGITGSLANTLTYYAKKANDTAAREMAEELLNRMWTNYRDEIGIAVEETRADYRRFFDKSTTTIHVPNGWTGKMANGDDIKPGIGFLDIRSKYKSMPEFGKVQAAWDSGDFEANAPTFTYHRFWGQVDAAVAYGTYAMLFEDAGTIPDPNHPNWPTAPGEEPTPIAALDVNLAITQDWGSGSNGELTITNTGDVPTASWSLEMKTNIVINTFWTATIMSGSSDGHYFIKPAAYDQVIQPGESKVLGFSSSSGNVQNTAQITSYTFTVTE
ncbi:cellulose binding domain-containing protein [Vallitalea pronyensis]|uniref:Cellulose binding domain-containing protein n=1 Tax=Vallitalea pronyensis TaxID=1348613 RepID=A0A8J8MPB4_9FIRM|nr:glycoside hydrolase family 48 protein [Vallitalea pronyensis]QUI25072.1 cellulose binding domain-containing protein [Vallitalea pronyensis]